MLSMTSSHFFKASAFCLSLIVLASCAKREEELDTSMTTDSTVMTENTTTGDSLNNPNGGANAGLAGMNDANILAVMSMSDSLEIAAGQLAKTKAKHADVKKFANMMVTDHTKMKREGQTLAQKANITPTPPTMVPGASDMTASMDALRNAEGASFDSLYIAQQISMHEMVLNNLNTASAQDTSLSGLITRAKTHVQHHLDEARSIQGKLTSQ